MAPVRIEAGQTVRWRQGGRWRCGHIGTGVVERDGSLRVYDDFNGAARALRPTRVERQVRGPRGGRRWEPCQPLTVMRSGSVVVWRPARVEQLSLFGRPEWTR